MERRSDTTVFRLQERGTEPVPLRPEALAHRTRVPSLPRIVGSFRGPRPESRVCPLCGWTADRFLETKLLGCGLCHTVFAELIATQSESGASEQADPP